MIRLRPFHVSDAWAMRRLMHDAVRTGARSKYDAAQREAWSPTPKPPPGWDDRLADHITLVAEEVTDEVDVPLGFGTMRRDGYLDLLFVRPDRMGTGIAGRIHDGLLDAVAEHRPARLTTRASLYARPFLAARRWRLLGDAVQERDGVRIPAFDMERDPPPVP